VQPLKKLAFSAILALATLAMAAPAQAADVAVLRNGFEVRHQRREVAGEKTRLYVTSGGYVEVATSDIVSLQHEEYVAPVAAELPAAPPAASFDLHQLAAKASGELNKLALKWLGRPLGELPS